jgi:hypothetical protein
MNLNPFSCDFQVKNNWGADGQKKLANMAKSEKFEASNGRFETTDYSKQKTRDPQDIIETSSPQQIKHWLEMKDHDRQGVPGITL